MFSTIQIKEKQWALLPILLILLVFIPLYVKTMLPGLGYTGDTAKFQFIGKVMGVPHATGYPLYVILNKIFIQIPLGSIAFRANLMSVFFALITLILFFYTARRVSHSTTAAFFSTVAFGMSFSFWEQALVAEVYSLNAFLLIACVYCLVLWQQSGQSKLLYAFFFIYALSFGNHMTMITVFPGFMLFIFLVDRKVVFGIKNWLIALAAIILGAGQYLFLMLRTLQQASYLEHQVLNLTDIYHLLSGKQFQSSMFVFSLTELLRERLPMIGCAFINDLNWPIIILGLIGGLVLLRNNRHLFFLFCIAIAGQLFYIANYNIPDIYVYFIPPFLLFVLFSSVGLARLEFNLSDRTWPLIILYLLFSIFLLKSMGINYAQVDFSKDTFAENRFHEVFQALPHNALIVTDNYLDSQFADYMILAEYPEKRLRHLRVYFPDDLKHFLVRRILEEAGIKKTLIGIDNDLIIETIDEKTFVISKQTYLKLAEKGIVTALYYESNENYDSSIQVWQIIDFIEFSRYRLILEKIPENSLLISLTPWESDYIDYLILTEFKHKQFLHIHLREGQNIKSSMLINLSLYIKNRADLRDRYLSRINLDADINADFQILHLLRISPEVKQDIWDKSFLISEDTNNALIAQEIKTLTHEVISDEQANVFFYQVVWN